MPPLHTRCQSSQHRPYGDFSKKSLLGVSYHAPKEYPDVVTADQMSEMLRISSKTAYRILRENSIELTTYASYSMMIKSRIAPYFNDRQIKLKELSPKDIQDYYQYGLNIEEVSANTVIHRHANIRKALQYAVKTGLIEN